MLAKQVELKKFCQYIHDGDCIMVVGFGLVGFPLQLIEQIIQAERGNLPIFSNNLEEQGEGLGELGIQGRAKKTIGSYFTSNERCSKCL